jgi:hypothetical protein
MKMLNAILLTTALSLATSAAFAQANINGNTSAVSGADVGGNNAPPSGPRLRSIGPAPWTSGSGVIMGENSNANIGGSGAADSWAYSPSYYSPYAMDAWGRHVPSRGAVRY